MCWGECILGGCSSHTPAYMCWFTVWKVDRGLQKRVFTEVAKIIMRFRSFKVFLSKSWGSLFVQKLRFWACNPTDLEVKVLGRFLKFLCLKFHLDRKLPSQTATSMRGWDRKTSTDPTAHISYYFRCREVFLKNRIWDLFKTIEIVEVF